MTIIVFSTLVIGTQNTTTYSFMRLFEAHIKFANRKLYIQRPSVERLITRPEYCFITLKHGAHCGIRLNRASGAPGTPAS